MSPSPIDRCCYYYHTIPGNNSECHPLEGTEVFLPCNIYVPHDSNNNSLGTVSWFRSIGLKADKIGPIEEVVGKYSITVHRRSASFTDEASQFYQLHREIHDLTIRNISSSDNGCYWCEIEGNETCFNRSLFVNISVNTSISSISPDSVCQPFNYRSSLVCATSTCSTTKTTPLVSLTPSTGSLYYIPTTTSKVLSTTMNTITLTPTTLPTMAFTSYSIDSPESENLPNTGLCIILPVLVGSLLIILMMICCIGVCIHCRKRKRRRCKLSKYVIYSCRTVTVTSI